MKIALIKISNILGIDERRLIPGDKLNLVKGQNGKGKSSIIKSIQAALSGQSVKEATLLRNGAESGEVVLELTDGTVISKRITNDGSKLSIKGERKPAEYISNILDGIAFNPVQFLLETDENRLKILLQHLKVQVSGAELLKAAPMLNEDDLRDDDVLNFAGYSQKRKWVYDERTATNRILKEKRASLNQMLINAPDESVLTQLDEASLEELEKKKESLSAKKEFHFNGIMQERQKEIDAVNAKYDKMKEDLLTAFNKKVEPITAKIAELRLQQQNLGAIKQQLEFIATMQKDVENYENRSFDLDKALDKLEVIYLNMFKDIPIDGLTINEGIIHIDGVRFQHVNTARQLEFMMQLAKLRMGELKVMVVDGIEVLDPGKRNSLLSEIQKQDLQVFLTQVTDDEQLTIEN